MEQLKIDIDPEVFKLQDTRVSRLRSGMLSAQAFALMLKPEDPFVLIGHTIYALTEQEHYVLQKVYVDTGITEADFRKIIALEDLTFMTSEDAAFLQEVSKVADSCPICKYNRYKDEIYKLAKKYNLKLENTKEAVAEAHEYPERTAELESKVFSLLDPDFRVEVPKRKECLDCVEKHLAQAWVLSNEASNGYPEYITFVIGHLSEAFAECPKTFKHLYDTIEFCLARTKYARKAFVPLAILLPMLTYAREAISAQEADTNEDTGAGVFELDLTDAIKAELEALPRENLARLLKNCKTVIAFIPEVEKDDDKFSAVSWEGAMASTADDIVQIAPLTANMLRNRRLLFAINPRLARSSGYDLQDVIEYVSKLL